MKFGRKGKQLATPQAPCPRLRVGFVLAERFTLTAFSGFVDAIRLAADESDRSEPIDCSWSVLSADTSPIASSSQVRVLPDATMERPAQFDYIVVVGGLMHGGQHVAPGTVSFLQDAARAQIPLVGLCTGPFILARAGLLDGYQTCVSWLHRAEFEAEFPDIRVDSSRMFVIDRDRLTCAGGTSVVHLAAHLIERHCSRTQAIKSLRIMIEEQPLPSGAWQPEAIITQQAQDSLVKRAMFLIEENLACPTSIAEIASLLEISGRQLERRFTNDIGLSAREYRQELRMKRAKWMIEHTSNSITEIGLECGFTESAQFAKTFKQRTGCCPSDHRRRARAPG